MRRFFLCLSIFFLFTSNLFAQERHIQCKVVGISDGDTLTCLHNRTELKVRLVYIDAPESAQPFGNRAKQALSQLAFKKQVTLQATGYDKYHRVLAVVFDGNRNINLELVEKGMAWAYRQSQPIYEQAMAEARASSIGLWRDSHPIDPADWRKAKKGEVASDNKRSIWRHILPNWFGSTNQARKSTNSRTFSGDLNCQQKLSCNKIGDYELAKRYYQQCGWKELDGNNDGIVCNKLYRKANADR